MQVPVTQTSTATPSREIILRVKLSLEKLKPWFFGGKCRQRHNKQQTDADAKNYTSAGAHDIQKHTGKKGIFLTGQPGQTDDYNMSYFCQYQVSTIATQG